MRRRRPTSIGRIGAILLAAVVAVLLVGEPAEARDGSGPDDLRDRSAGEGESRSYEVEASIAWEMATAIPAHEIEQGPVKFSIGAPDIRYRSTSQWTIVWALSAEGSAPGHGPMLQGLGVLLFNYADGRLTISSFIRFRAGYALINWSAEFPGVEFEFTLSGGLEIRTHLTFHPEFRFGFIEVGPYGEGDFAMHVMGSFHVEALAYAGGGVGLRPDDVPETLLVDLYLQYMARAAVRVWWVQSGGHSAGHVRRVLARAHVDGLNESDGEDPIDHVDPAGPTDTSIDYDD